MESYPKICIPVLKINTLPFLSTGKAKIPTESDGGNCEKLIQNSVLLRFENTIKHITAKNQQFIISGHLKIESLNLSVGILNRIKSKKASQNWKALKILLFFM